MCKNNLGKLMNTLLLIISAACIAYSIITHTTQLGYIVFLFGYSGWFALYATRLIRVTSPTRSSSMPMGLGIMDAVAIIAMMICFPLAGFCLFVLYDIPLASVFASIGLVCPIPFFVRGATLTTNAARRMFLSFIVDDISLIGVLLSVTTFITSTTPNIMGSVFYVSLALSITSSLVGLISFQQGIKELGDYLEAQKMHESLVASNDEHN